ncbi:Nucleosomal histone kinase 1 [Strongyloides ratti]|uniref:non-specific serine/threonine protein kinase n=1 Tax=Strongyloides ratti TaxID=34506 RepID=A0A090KXP8_STRRB|nr:Nucleosomal histone kinase 1 [Strongyloides ratti]CEF62270.1 Nucleosomal histone kinase 1 [Strongyloides ratti]
MPPKRGKKVGGEADLAPILSVGTTFSNPIVRDTVEVTKYIGNGGFGRIYEGKLVNKKMKICIKMEKICSSGLFVEKENFMRFLKKDLLEKWFKKEFISLPYLVCFGIYTINSTDKLRYLAMPWYEEVLSNYINQKVDLKLTQEEAKKVSLCVLQALEYLHNVKISHRDIKKENLMLVNKNCLDKVVLIDLGISQFHTRFIETINPKAKHNGTLLYTSTDAHIGREGVFRSDLEIFGYNLIEWLSGSLPWKGLESKPEEVYKMKQAIVNDPKTEINLLLPSMDTSFIKGLFILSNSLSYCEVPPYNNLKKLLKDWVITAKNCTKKISSKKELTEIRSSCKENEALSSKNVKCKPTTNLNEIRNDLKRSARNCGKRVDYTE